MDEGRWSGIFSTLVADVSWALDTDRKPFRPGKKLARTATNCCMCFSKLVCWWTSAVSWSIVLEDAAISRTSSCLYQPWGCIPWVQNKASYCACSMSRPATMKSVGLRPSKLITTSPLAVLLCSSTVSWCLTSANVVSGSIINRDTHLISVEDHVLSSGRSYGHFSAWLFSQSRTWCSQSSTFLSPCSSRKLTVNAARARWWMMACGIAAVIFRSRVEAVKLWKLVNKNVDPCTCFNCLAPVGEIAKVVHGVPPSTRSYLWERWSNPIQLGPVSFHTLSVRMPNTDSVIEWEWRMTFWGMWFKVKFQHKICDIFWQGQSKITGCTGFVEMCQDVPHPLTGDVVGDYYKDNELEGDTG